MIVRVSGGCNTQLQNSLVSQLFRNDVQLREYTGVNRRVVFWLVVLLACCVLHSLSRSFIQQCVERIAPTKRRSLMTGSKIIIGDCMLCK